MAKSAPQDEKSPSELIDERIREFGDRRGVLRASIRQADPELAEAW